jgi:heme/copper-type cytochrome/quinol oxidase subunit 2
MSLRPRYFAPLLLVAGTAAIAVAAIAAAEPVLPVPGNQSAADTLRELQVEGYTLQINWVTGYPNVPLSECWVDAIHNPDGPPASQNTLAIVYVDIGCPEHQL